MLDCKGSGQEKWSSGLQEALPTDHNGDVPNGYAWRARTPLRQWCNRIPILAIHPDWDPDFSDPNFSDPDFSDPNLGLSSRNLTTDIFKKKSAKNDRL
jgi:hypothetical protein